MDMVEGTNQGYEVPTDQQELVAFVTSRPEEAGRE